MAKKVKTLSTSVVKEIRYREGSPKQYRADAKTGTFNINGRTEVGNSLTFHPIAYRHFRDNLFNRGEMEWIELFFIDENNCISSIMFSGYSLKNMRRFTGELFYENVTLTDVVIEVTWEKHKNEAANAVYHIASFNVVEEVSDKVKEAVAALVGNVEIYRHDTITPTCMMLEKVNYRFPKSLLSDELIGSIEEIAENTTRALESVDAVTAS